MHQSTQSATPTARPAQPTPPPPPLNILLTMGRRKTRRTNELECPLYAFSVYCVIFYAPPVFASALENLATICCSFCCLDSFAGQNEK